MHSILAFSLFFALAIAVPAPQVMRTRPDPASAPEATVAHSGSALEQCISTHNDHIQISNVVFDASVFSFKVHNLNLDYPVVCHFDNTQDLKDANLPCTASQPAPNGGDIVLISLDKDTGMIQMEQRWSCLESQDDGSATFSYGFKITAEDTLTPCADAGCYQNQDIRVTSIQSSGMSM